MRQPFGLGQHSRPRVSKRLDRAPSLTHPTTLRHPFRQRAFGHPRGDRLRSLD